MIMNNIFYLHNTNNDKKCYTYSKGIDYKLLFKRYKEMKAETYEYDRTQIVQLIYKYYERTGRSLKGDQPLLALMIDKAVNNKDSELLAYCKERVIRLIGNLPNRI